MIRGPGGSWEGLSVTWLGRYYLHLSGARLPCGVTQMAEKCASNLLKIKNKKSANCLLAERLLFLLVLLAVLQPRESEACLWPE